MDAGDKALGGAQTNILIVDDLPEKHLAYQAMLEELGVNIVAAHSGTDALKLILQMDFAVILLDVNMPGMDGFETARLIHQRKRSASTPIIFLTAFADEVRMAQGYATGAVDYLPMPIVPGILRAKVRVFVDLFEMRRKMAQQAEERAKQAAVQDANLRLSFLADASAKLGRSLDITATVRDIVRLPIPFLADVSVLKMTSTADNNGRFLTARFKDDDYLEVEELDKVDSSLSDVSEAIDRVMTRNHSELLTGRPGIVLPLQARGRTVAVLALYSESKTRFFNANDISLSEAFSFRSAMALDNALLHEEIRSSDRQKNDFLSMLAHELRNPLAPIRNAVQLLENTANFTETKWACDVIDRQVDQLVRLVDDLLDVARITHDKIHLHREPIELTALVNFALEASRPLIDLRKHRLHVLLSQTPMHIQGDMARLAQVLTNLLNNAVKFMEEQGQIWLSTSSEEDWAVIRVKDSGIGIPPRMLESVFQLFTQVDRTLDRTHEGLGIGLTIVKRLVEKHEGTVEARSDGPGCGSEFIVRLPLIKTPEASRRTHNLSPDQTSRTHSKRRVLVVDDNRDSAQSLAMMLNIMGHQTALAYDGLEAIEVNSTFKPDLILLDIGLPRLNGYEVCQRIREQLDGNSIAIVALTGWGQKEDHRRSMEAGFDHHLVKPVDINTLKELIASLKIPQEQCVS